MPGLQHQEPVDRDATRLVELIERRDLMQKQLDKLVTKYGSLHDIHVVAYSQRLDKLLNEIYRLSA